MGVPKLPRDTAWYMMGPRPGERGSAVIAGIASTIAAAGGDDVLDLAAAPGGKSQVMRARGAHVISNDISISRLRPLIGKSNSIVVSDGRQPSFSRQFRVVLLHDRGVWYIVGQDLDLANPLVAGVSDKQRAIRRTHRGLRPRTAE